MLYAELADAGIGMVLLLVGVFMLKDRIKRGWVLLAYMCLQAVWAAFMLLYNLWTLTDWVLLVDVVWLAVLIAAVKFTQMAWRVQRSWLEVRDAERLVQTLLNHERIEE